MKKNSTGIKQNSAAAANSPLTPCTVCSKLFGSQKSMRIHRARSHIPENAACTICEEPGDTIVDYVSESDYHINFFLCNDCKYQTGYNWSEETARLAVTWGLTPSDTDNFLSTEE